MKSKVLYMMGILGFLIISGLGAVSAQVDTNHSSWETDTSYVYERSIPIGVDSALAILKRGSVPKNARFIFNSDVTAGYVVLAMSSINQKVVKLQINKLGELAFAIDGKLLNESDFPLEIQDMRGRSLGVWHELSDISSKFVTVKGVTNDGDHFFPVHQFFLLSKGEKFCFYYQNFDYYTTHTTLDSYTVEKDPIEN